MRFWEEKEGWKFISMCLEIRSGVELRWRLFSLGTSYAHLDEMVADVLR